MLEKEKERREAETTAELRRLFTQEQDKFLKAIGESEANLTKIDLYKSQFEKLESGQQMQAKT